MVRLGSLGDLVHALPAVAELRSAWPDARIDWLVEEPHAELLQLVPVVNEVIVVSGRSVGGWLATRKALRSRRYDLAIDFQGLVKSAALARLSGARRVVGFDAAALREPAARHFYTATAMVGEGRHVIDKNLALAAHVSRTFAGRTFRSGAGESDRGERLALQFPLALQPSPALDELRGQGVGDFALINPGAAWPNKRWSPERFASVARWIRETRGWTPVVLWGPGEEGIADAIVSASQGVAVRAPATTFNDLLMLARSAKLLVSGDTGPLHLACAVGAPVVSLFGPTTERRNGPWDDRDVSISRYDSCVCHYERVCRRSPEDWCLGEISVDQVTAAITRRLDRA